VQYGVQELYELAEAAGRTGTVLVVDEAFIDFIPLERQVSLLPVLDRYPRHIAHRSDYSVAQGTVHLPAS
jgi:threonine-phosphate decarboxylase